MGHNLVAFPRGVDSRKLVLKDGQIVKPSPIVKEEG
jgi:hypothetical protein